ncbi:hydrogenase [Capilliphycus salinus ALCB114379]|uniref:hydrogenase n=1 Tax=Capilliphycus salinus TaxID=2768948 RepID=UPI0039A41D1E
MESTDQTLLQQLSSLSKRYASLGSRLSQAAQHLSQAGIPLPETLLEELVKYNRDFNHLQQQARAEDESISDAEMSLSDLEKRLQQKIQPGDSQNQRSFALSLLERVLSLVHKDQSAFEPLERVKQSATQLQTQISNNTPELSPEVKALISGEHPLSALLTLIETPEDIDDQHWVILEEKVSARFGKPLAVAISRGKIVRSTNSPELTSASAPAANPDLVILGEPTSRAPQDVIIVPSVEVPKTPPTIDGTHIVFGNAPLAGKSSPSTASGLASVGLKVRVSIHRLGDREFAAQEYAGTRGQGLPLEAFQIAIAPPVPGLSLRYMAHISNLGDSPATPEGQRVGQPGNGQQIEGFAIELTGPQASNYKILYTAHVQNIGDVPVCSNGQYCGTRGKGLRVEGIQVWIQPKA